MILHDYFFFPDVNFLFFVERSILRHGIQMNEKIIILTIIKWNYLMYMRNKNGIANFPFQSDTKKKYWENNFVQFIWCIHMFILL